MTVSELLAKVARHGASVYISQNGKVAVDPIETLSPDLIQELQRRKEDIFDELHCRLRSSDTMFGSTKRLYELGRPSSCWGGRNLERCVRRSNDEVDCASCSKYRVRDCSTFVVGQDYDDASCQTTGMCIACGIPWRLHGQPPPHQWRRVRNADEVALIEAQLVLAIAKQIVLKDAS